MTAVLPVFQRAFGTHSARMCKHLIRIYSGFDNDVVKIWKD